MSHWTNLWIGGLNERYIDSPEKRVKGRWKDFGHFGRW